MKTESNNNKMDFDLYPSISSGKQQDTVREVVMKYIDSFFPDASGTSAVAIDNKIEQAMDLVKSHLMIAVREEVEVLKEKISELMDKISQLEVENTILKANMSQETLQQLQTQLQLAGGTATGNNMLTAPPSQQQQQQQQQQQAGASVGSVTNVGNVVATSVGSGNAAAVAVAAAGSVTNNASPIVATASPSAIVVSSADVTSMAAAAAASAPMTAAATLPTATPAVVNMAAVVNNTTNGLMS